MKYFKIKSKYKMSKTDCKLFRETWETMLKMKENKDIIQVKTYLESQIDKLWNEEIELEKLLVNEIIPKEKTTEYLESFSSPPIFSEQENVINYYYSNDDIIDKTIKQERKPYIRSKLKRLIHTDFKHIFQISFSYYEYILRKLTSCLVVNKQRYHKDKKQSKLEKLTNKFAYTPTIHFQRTISNDNEIVFMFDKWITSHKQLKPNNNFPNFKIIGERLKALRNNLSIINYFDPIPIKDFVWNLYNIDNLLNCDITDSIYDFLSHQYYISSQQLTKLEDLEFFIIICQNSDLNTFYGQQLSVLFIDYDKNINKALIFNSKLKKYLGW